MTDEDRLVFLLSGALRDEGVELPEGSPAVRKAIRQVVAYLGESQRSLHLDGAFNAS